MSAAPSARRSSGVLAVVYLASLVAAVSLFFAVRHVGEQLTAPDPLGEVVGPRTSGAPEVDVQRHVLATLAAIVALGAVVPHDSRLCRELVARLQDVVTILFLPAFFAVTGMNTRIGLIQGWENWLICWVILAVATIGKFGGSLAAARFAGLDWRTSAALGSLMNTRGLMELIVLNIGLSLGVISPTLFAMMVLMALATTLATSPVLGWLKVSEPTT